MNNSQGFVDPKNYTEFKDEDHTVLCEWWYNDRKYKGWFKMEDLEPANDCEADR